MMKTYLKQIVLVMAILFLSACKYHDIVPQYVKVCKADGSIQCEYAGIEPEVMALELTDAGIEVICSQKGWTGLSRPALCGLPTGSINVFEINNEDLPAAEALGFEPVSTLSQYHDDPCE